MIGGILTISGAYNDRAIYSYKLASESSILTGGEFGIESSIVSVLGFIVVIALTLFLMKRKVENCNNSTNTSKEITI